MLRKSGWRREIGRQREGIRARKRGKEGERKDEEKRKYKERQWVRARMKKGNFKVSETESGGKTPQTLWLITDMSSAGWHCKSIVKAFIRCLEVHGAPSLSARFMLHTVRGRGSISSSLCLYKSEQVRTLRHAVGVIITLEDYNDTPPRTRSPVSTVIKQLLFAVEALYMRRVCRCVCAH